MPDAPRIIVLTGATRGLGRALVTEFAARGHTLWACGRSEAAIEKLGRDYPPPHRWASVDVAHPAGVEAWAAQLLASGLVPDLVINNAALTNQPAPLWKVPRAEFDSLIDVNIKGVVNVIRAFAPAMVKRSRGVFVNLSSGWGRSVSPEVAPYCASKWAIEGLSKAMAEEVPAGMAVVPLNPGIIDTEMLRICFGSSAGNYEGPSAWATKAAPFLLKLGPEDNGKSLTVPGVLED